MADKYVGSLLNRIVLPGDVIGSVADLEGSLEGKNKVKLGLGLREVNGAIVAFKRGFLDIETRRSTWSIAIKEGLVSVKYFC